MNDRTFETLEFFDFIELAARRTQTPPGRARMTRMRPSVSLEEIRAELEITSECVAWQNTKGRFGLAGVEDIEPIAAQLHIRGAALEPRQILAVERMLFVGKELREAVRSMESAGQFPHLQRISAKIPDMRNVLAAIRGKILPNGEIDDNASPELRDIRKEMAERRYRINRTLESILRASPQAVQEDIITFRNGRFVIPIRTDSRSRIPGVMHGLSSSGQTTYIEPMTVINQNNDLVRLREQEDIEIARILSAITEVFRVNAAAILSVLETIAELDVAQARALVAIEFQCVPPRVVETCDYELTDARHILLEHSLRKTGGQPTPISITLDERHRILVISGPNAGGKTVALKTAGLSSMMAQMGFHVPAKNATLPVFDQIFADIGDHQSITANLSTFTAHMRNIAEMAGQLHPPALILLDEVGAGTDPDEGAALAIAIIDFFRQAGAVTLASTHYPKLKMWASQTDGVKNAAVEFDERTLRPTYRLLPDIAGASSGIKIARRMNIPESILTAARTLIEPDHAQAREYLKQLRETLDAQMSLRASLEEERKAVAEKYAGLEQEYAKREAARKAEFDAALSRIVDGFRKESEKAVKKVTDSIEAARAKRTAENLASELRRKSVHLRQNIASSVAEIASEPSTVPHSGGAGTIEAEDVVYVRSLNREGRVEDVQDGTYAIAIGALRYRTERDDLEKLERGKPAVPPAPRSVNPDDPEFSSELKVIGLTVDEALDQADRFLDQAFLAGVESVRIIHGHGKGILRGALARFLSEHAQVARFTHAPPEKGGSGATVVFLKP